MLRSTAIALALLSGSALAGENELRFNHLGLEYGYADADGSTGDGYGADLNFALHKNVFVTIDANTRTLDINGSDLELGYVSGGLGGNLALNDEKTIQIFATATWEELDITLDGATDPNAGDPNANGDNGGGGTFCTGSPIDQLTTIISGEDCSGASAPAKALGDTTGNQRLHGYGVALGARALFFDALEVNGSYSFRDYDERDEQIFGLGLNYILGDWRVVLNYELYQEIEMDEITAGVQYTFGMSDGGSSIW